MICNKALAKQVLNLGIRVNSMAPGWTACPPRGGKERDWRVHGSVGEIGDP